MISKYLPFVKKNKFLIFLFFFTFILELWFSNNPSSFFSSDEETKVPLSEFVLENCTTQEEAGILFTENNASCVYIPADSSISLHNVYLDFEGEQEALVQGEIRIKDESHTENFLTLNQFRINPAGIGEVVVPVKSAGNMTQLAITLTNGANVTLSDVVLNYSPGIQFHWLRWFLMAAFVLSILFMKHYKLGSIYYDPQNKTHILAAVFPWIVNIVMILFIMINTLGENTDIPYPLESGLDRASLMVKQFDAFQKGQLHLDMSKEAEPLLTLENPYDPSQRASLGSSYYWLIWDHAFYEGKFYSYFGVTPIFIIYYPHYWLFGTLPSDAKAGMILSLLFVTLFILLIHRVISCFKIHVNMIAVLLSMLAVPSASLLFMLQVNTNFYYLVYLSAYVFITGFLYSSIAAYENIDSIRGSIWYAVAGICLVLSVASRPTTIVPAFIMILPLYIHVLTKKELNLKKKTKLVAGFAIPTALGAFVIMWYNAARFGSPFDFGMAYQLTESDIRYNKLNFSAAHMWSYLNQYWLHPLKLNDWFPFIDYSVTQSFSDGHYLRQGSSHGCDLFVTAFSVPQNLLLLAIPWYVKRKKARYQKNIILGGILSSFIILYINSCLGGVHIRYICDGMLVLAMISCLIAWELLEYFDQKQMFGAKKAVYAILTLSTVMGWLLIFNTEYNFIQKYAPDTFIRFLRFFSLT